MHETLVVDEHHQAHSDATDVLGFWLYIMTDCILFGCLFATFVVLNNSMHGPMLKDYLNLRDILIETFLLLASNFTFCLAILNLYLDRSFWTQIWLLTTFLFGAAFVTMELIEFRHLVHEGFGWNLSAQASSFFTLVGTHGLHVSIGLLWIVVMIIQLSVIQNHNILVRRMTYLGLFWNFLDIVWIFVFTVVYLTEALR